MSPEDVAHEWVRARLAAWAAGTLDRDAAARLERHLETCKGCRVLGEAGMAVDIGGAPGDHIPAAVLATWDRSAAELDGLLRDLVQHHLEHCATCRAVLEQMGQPAELPGPALKVVESRGRLRADRAPGWLGQNRWTWGRVAAAAAAVMVVAWALFQAGVIRVPALVPAVTRPHSSGVYSPPEPLLALAPATPQAADLLGDLRGGSTVAAPVRVSFDLASRTVTLRPPRELGLSSARRIELTVVDASGRELRRLETTMDALFPGDSTRAVVIRQGEPVIGPGHYALRVRAWTHGGGAPDTALYRFEIR